MSVATLRPLQAQLIYAGYRLLSCIDMHCVRTPYGYLPSVP